MGVSSRQALADLIGTSGHIIVRGPLNHAYRVESGRDKWFVRKRIIADGEYSQTFAAERWVYPSVSHLVNVPRLHQVLPSPNGQGACAIFDYIDHIPIDWSRKEVIVKLAEALAHIHSVASDCVGYVGSAGPAADYDGAMKSLLHTELERFHCPNPGITALLSGYSEYADRHVVFNPEDNCLCHGDVHQGNFLLDHAGKLWVIDWEAARFRAAASDFNQAHYRWLSEDRQDLLLETYCKLTGKDKEAFMRGVVFFRVLWHVRTYNFYTRVKKEPEADHTDQLTAIQDMLGRML
ncbi:hypothetical protein PSTEL_11975 [Paenibacillus stellifer]|uniref:Aminoglycoside phosphotransferase domain-containing protein n=1 Tax=Paenibacillus stellifer TaxID=169760 RepID=A0A089LRZ4_9BACL|nr:aminoglycoside phosphotransferase family protein [Paenibacillus stellifer]AIQ63692.1 hypothetical protein PSTEL_11975 [Paenibacillus stellifer]